MSSKLENEDITAEVKEKLVKEVKFLITKSETRSKNTTPKALKEIPYNVICRKRYTRSKWIHRNQFIEEIELHEHLQSNALDGLRIYREFANTILCQPRPKDLIRLTQNQKRRVEKILARTKEY